MSAPLPELRLTANATLLSRALVAHVRALEARVAALEAPPPAPPDLAIRIAVDGDYAAPAEER